MHSPAVREHETRGCLCIQYEVPQAIPSSLEESGRNVDLKALVYALMGMARGSCCPSVK